MTHDMRESGLDAFFEAARARTPEPDAALLARVERDALRLMPVAPEPGWRQLWAAIGGSAGLGGLVAASAAGLYIGLAAPAELSAPVSAALGVQSDLDPLSHGAFDIASLLEE